MEPVKNKGGRPKIELDEDQVLKLAQIGCTLKEMSHFFGVSVDTLERRYQDIIQAGHTEVKMSIRRKQLELALNGDKALLIWLGKQFLGQREPKDVPDYQEKGLDSITFVDDDGK